MTRKKALLERIDKIADRLIEARQDCSDKAIEIDALNERIRTLSSQLNLEFELHTATKKVYESSKRQLISEHEFRSQLHEVVDYFLDRLKLTEKYTIGDSEGEIEPELDIENLLADVRLATKRADVSAARKRLGLKE